MDFWVKQGGKPETASVKICLSSIGRFSSFSKNRVHFPHKNIFPLFPPLLKSGGNFMKDGECAELKGENNKKILRFLFFELSRNLVESCGDDVTK